MSATNGTEENNMEMTYRQQARQKVIVDEQIARIVEIVLEDMKRVRYICFQSQQEPFRSVTRMRCAGCVQPVRSVVPKAGTIDAICEAAKKGPIKLESETLSFKEKEPGYALFENMCNREITRAIAFETEGFVIYLFLTKSSITPNFVDVINQAKQLLSRAGLSLIQLVEVPKRSALPIVDLSNQTTFNYRGQILPYALRQTKRQKDQAIIFFAISPQRPKWEWRIQELVMLQLKFPQVYFLTTVTEMKPEHFDRMCQTCYWLNKLNLVWFVNFQDPKIANYFEEDLFYYETIRPNLTAEKLGNDLDDLYNILLDKYYPNSDPNPTEADVILQLPKEDQMVYYGVSATIQSRQKAEEPPPPPAAPPQRRSRTADLLGDPDAPVMDSDEEAGDKDGDGDEGNDEIAGDDEEKPPGEAELRQQYCNTKVVMFMSPRTQFFLNTVQELGRIRRNFLNCDIFICIANVNRLNYSQYVSKLPELHKDLGTIWDIDNLYNKIAGTIQCSVQVFDKQNKLLYDGNDYLRAIELIRKRETKKMKTQRLYLFGDLDEVKPKKKKSRQESRSNQESPVRELQQVELELSGVKQYENIQLEEKPAVDIESIPQLAETEINIHSGGVSAVADVQDTKVSAYQVIQQSVQEDQQKPDQLSTVEVSEEQKASKRRSRKQRGSGEEGPDQIVQEQNVQSPEQNIQQLQETVIPPQKEITETEQEVEIPDTENNESPGPKSSKKRSRKHKSEENVEDIQNKPQQQEEAQEAPQNDEQQNPYEKIAEGTSPRQPKKKKKRSSETPGGAEPENDIEGVGNDE